MSHQHLLPGHTLKIVTAAVMLALGGGAPVLAQQQQQDRQAQDAWPEQQREQREQPQEREQDGWQDRDAIDDGPDATATATTATDIGRLDEVAQQHDGLGKFVDAVKVAGMEDSLLRGTYTVFAPTDQAIEEAGGDELLDADPAQIADLLRAHIVADDLDREMAGRIPQAMTLDGGTVELEERDGQLTVDGANVEDTEIQVAGLRIFPIDRVLADVARSPQDQEDW
jgi:uncharacterized surface protein with fasciclin (FAS1) repeats